MRGWWRRAGLALWIIGTVQWSGVLVAVVMWEWLIASQLFLGMVCSYLALLELKRWHDKVVK